MNCKIFLAIAVVVGLSLIGGDTRACSMPQIAGSTVDLWERYKARFITPDGRVLDTGNESISHSEGQGYGMIFAVAQNDPMTFARLWSWTYTNLLIRSDGLLVWRWGPDENAPYTDMNSASDGDVLVAYALLRAAWEWDDPTYEAHALQLLASIREHLVRDVAGMKILLPGPYGFERDNGVVVNLSYWVFPAFDAFFAADNDPIWSALSASGKALVESAAFGPWGLPPDWMLLTNDGFLELPINDQYFEPVFGYNAIRIPLYLLWAHRTERAFMDRLAAFWNIGPAPDAMPIVANLESGEVEQSGSNAGFRSVRSLVDCARGQESPFSQAIQFGNDVDYYAGSLVLLTCLASRRTTWACSDN